MNLPTKEGPLHKYRNVLKGWEYRYFKLSRSYLHYYDAQHAPNPKKTLVRSEITSVSTCTAFPDRQHCFQLVTKSNERWYMTSSTESEMLEWIKVLTAHLPSSEASWDSRSWKEREAEESGRNTPPLPVPPLPRYMAEAMDEPPPSYDDCVYPDQTKS